MALPMTLKRGPLPAAQGAAWLDLGWRVAVVGAVSAGATILAGALASGAQLAAPLIDVGTDPGTALLLRVVSGALFALLLGPLSRRLAVGLAGRWFVLGLLLLVVNSLVNLIEAFYFTTFFEQGATFVVVVGVVQSLVVAGAVAVLFPAAVPVDGLGASLTAFF